MFRAIGLAFDQLGDRAVLWVLAKSMALTLVILFFSGIIFVTAALWLADAYGWGEEGGMWAGLIATLAAVAGAWLLFRAVAIPVIGLFADAVVEAVERKHYPRAAMAARAVPLSLSIRLGLMSVLRMVGINLLMLPVYIILLFTVVGPFIALLIVNAILLGRDLAEMVAARHLDTPARKAWLRAHRGQSSLMGGIVTLLFLIPFVNFVAPVVGAAMATHLFHGKEAA